ncbi:MAG: mechanosensitive ion channel family protein [Candidatus Norongarragalinales archaeon]
MVESTFFKIVYFLGITLGSLVIADVLIFLFDKFIRPIVLRTKTTFDDFLFEGIRGPFKFVAFLFGLYLAFQVSIPNVVFFDKNLNQLFFLALVLAAGHALSRVVDSLFYWHASQTESQQKLRISKDVFPLARKMSKLSILLVAFIIVLSEFGVEIGPLLAGLGIAGLAVALALQDTLSNFFSGVNLLSDKPFKVGDFIALDSENSETTGVVKEIGWRTTKIQTPRNSIIVIPNAELAKRMVHNLSGIGREKRRVLIDFGVSYSTNLDKLKKSLETCFENVKKRSGVVDESFFPVLRFVNFGDSSLQFRYIFQAKSFDDSFPLATEMRFEMVKQFRKDGIEIPFPIRTVYLKGEKRGKR